MPYDFFPIEVGLITYYSDHLTRLAHNVIDASEHDL